MSDHNYFSYCDVSDVEIPEGSTFQPPVSGEYDDVLKFSNAHRIKGRYLTVYGGRENCIDFNRTCADIELTGVRLINGDQAAIVIKGGTKRITLSDVLITPSRKAWCDVLIGDWSDQSNDLTTDITLNNVCRTDGKPVRVVVGRGIDPTIIGGNCRIQKRMSFGAKIYWWSKYCLRKLHIV